MDYKFIPIFYDVNIFFYLISSGNTLHRFWLMAPIKSNLILKYIEASLCSFKNRIATRNYFALQSSNKLGLYVSKFPKDAHLKRCNLHPALDILKDEGCFRHIRLCYERYFSSSTEKTILSMPPEEFVQFLKNKKINRCFFVWDEKAGKVVSSHPELKEIEDWLNSGENVHYKQHESIFISMGMRTSSLLGAFIWNTNRGQAVSISWYHVF